MQMFLFVSKLSLILLALSTVVVAPTWKHDHQTKPRSPKTAKRNVQVAKRDLDALVIAARIGDTNKVTELLGKGVDINGKASRGAGEASGQTALIAAAEAGHADMVRLLLTKGANVNVRHEAGGTALTAAAGRGHLEIVKELLKARADANVIVGNIHGMLYTALMFAMNSNNEKWLEIIDEMITAGAEVNPKGFALSPLRLIIDEDKPSMLQPLVQRGAKLNLQYEEGTTALMYAAQYGSPGMVRALLDAGSDVNLKNAKGETALSIAEKYSTPTWGQEVIKVLKARGADPD
jgi:uncharacterized protein